MRNGTKKASCVVLSAADDETNNVLKGKYKKVNWTVNMDG